MSERQATMLVTLLRLPRVCERAGIGKTKVYEMMRDGKFPTPVSVGRSRLWRSDEIQEWILSRPKIENQEAQQWKPKY